MAITVLQTGRVKELFDSIGINEIPITDNVDEFCTQLLILLSPNTEKFNDLMGIITGIDADWENEDIDDVMLRLTSFFVNMLPKFLPLLRRLKEENNIQQNGFLMNVQNEIMEKVLKTFSIGNTDSLKNEELEQKD